MDARDFKYRWRGTEQYLLNCWSWGRGRQVLASPPAVRRKNSGLCICSEKKYWWLTYCSEKKYSGLTYCSEKKYSCLKKTSKHSGLPFLSMVQRRNITNTETSTTHRVAVTCKVDMEKIDILLDRTSHNHHPYKKSSQHITKQVQNQKKAWILSFSMHPDWFINLVSSEQVRTVLFWGQYRLIQSVIHASCIEEGDDGPEACSEYLLKNTFKCWQVQSC